MSEALAQLHFLRPHWLWALLVLPLLALWWQAQRRRASVWRRHVDPHLLPHLVEAGASRRGLGGLLIRLLAWTLAVLALAGPSWRQGELPLQSGGGALVVALDLSDAMLTADLPPSRLLQARAKLATLLRERVDGDVALVAFSEDAYTVAPLTADGANVAIFLDALAPDVMPVDGHRPARAIEAAVALLEQAGYASGDILLLSHGADAAAVAAAAKAQAAGFRVSALGVGRPGGGSYRARDGSLSCSRLAAGA
ncbi:MAG TPA: VWA domain-containing protein, partial [Luteimonas sp.]|nr:VWA domain-containing protein [Luteimonas sp.]